MRDMGGSAVRLSDVYRLRIPGKEREETTELEFTVVDEERLPEELLKMVGEKKAEPFKLTYGDGGYLYLCVGYGKQPTGGCSISVNELYATDNAIYLDTNLTVTEGCGRAGRKSVLSLHRDQNAFCG